MTVDSSGAVIRVRGARQNNLRGIDLDLPVHRLMVITGLSGSGKSSLAFDTLYAEGQRRYIETFSPYARQFFDRMDKPRVDAIEGIPPAIALEQRNTVRTTRSTVGTMTEVCDHLKLLWPRVSRLHCRRCDREVVKESPRTVWETVRRLDSAEGGVGGAEVPAGEVLVTFRVPLSDRLPVEEQLALVARQGFQRVLTGGDVVRIEDWDRGEAARESHLTVVQDRVRLTSGSRARFVEACEQAYHFGHQKLEVVLPTASPKEGEGRWGRRLAFSSHLHCAACDLEYADPTPALFSFNHPIGACPACKGFGRIIAIDYDLAIPDRTRTLGQGAVKPWQSGMSAECQTDMVRFARKAGVPLDVPFGGLSPEHQRWVIEGDPDYGKGHEWPQAWYGVKGYFRWLESKAYKMHVRVLLSRYRAYRTCPSCSGGRFQPDTLLWRLPGGLGGGRGALTLAEFYALPVSEAVGVVEAMARSYGGPVHDPFALALAEVRGRLRFLADVGVGYLTLDRPTRTLSGGETQRVNLTTCLGSRLVNTLFVLDEPSVGLHPRDTERLVRILEQLRDLGNTVVVVEHEAAVMRAADLILDLGPGHGVDGGELVVQGTLETVQGHPRSLTGAYLSGRQGIEIPRRRPVIFEPSGAAGGGTSEGVGLELNDRVFLGEEGAASLPRGQSLQLRGVTRHNLRNLEVRIPLRRLVCLTGVSGSGKTTLAGELLRLLRQRLGEAASAGTLEVREDEREETPDGDSPAGEGGVLVSGTEGIEAVLLVDQSPIGRTPRSNPAVYCGAFDQLRELFAQTESARQRGLSSSAFSFNSAQGQCEQCRGAGFEKIEMQFLSDVYVRCPVCQGRRYRPHILEVRLGVPAHGSAAAGGAGREGGVSIADLLEFSIDEAVAFLAGFSVLAASRARDRLRILQDVGLGYLRLGQPINTLSGGESQRLKLAGHLVEARPMGPGRGATDRSARASRSSVDVDPRGAHTLFVFDEPTTGLHFEDVRVLLRVFQHLVDAGHSVLIIEHNVEVLKCADWLIDLGPEGGAEGGKVVVTGTPETVAACEASHTGRALRGVLGRGGEAGSERLEGGGAGGRRAGTKRA